MGGVVTLVGCIGMERFGDFFMRLDAPIKAMVLGAGGVLLASLGLPSRTPQPPDPHDA